jgi:hypothetical protein
MRLIIDRVVKPRLHQLLFISFSNKFTFFKSTRINPFLSTNDVHEFELLFCKVQRTYYGFARLALLYKRFNAKLVVDTDVYLNKLCLGDKHVLCVDNKYLFAVRDLITIINNSLSNSHALFSNPQPIKNPYTNLPFRKSTLYNIFFYIKFHTCYKVELFDLFFEASFHLRMFFNQNEHVLREYAIRDYLETSPTHVLYDELTEMMDELNEALNKDKFIDDEFPHTRIVKTMKPYLSLWLIWKYSLVPTTQYCAYRKLIRKFKVLIKFNPAFGRKIVRRGGVVEFSDDVPPFIIPSRNFLTTHV